MRRKDKLIDKVIGPINKIFGQNSVIKISGDITYGDLIKTEGWKRTAIALPISLFSFGISAVPHELIHAGTNSLLGGTNKDIVLNTLYGGSLWDKIITGVNSKLMIPIIGGYVIPDNFEAMDFAARATISMAPYIMTPLGIILAREGKERKNLAFAVAGTGIIIGHAGGVYGDFLNIGKNTFYNTLAYSAEVTGYENFREIYPQKFVNDSFAPHFIGFLIGWKIMDYTYNLSSSIVDKVRNYFKSHTQKI